MKTLAKILVFILPALLLFSCQKSHFITDQNEREIIYADFELKKKEMAHGNLFGIFEQEMPLKEKEALMFLYAYMPISDIADFDGEYHLKNVQSAFLAQKEMTCGKNIPEREFRHFVLPVRANNEKLDDARQVFYEELKDRVKNLNLYDAVLEVNH